MKKQFKTLFLHVIMCLAIASPLHATWYTKAKAHWQNLQTNHPKLATTLKYGLSAAIATVAICAANKALAKSTTPDDVIDPAAIPENQPLFNAIAQADKALKILSEEGHTETLNDFQAWLTRADSTWTNESLNTAVKNPFKMKNSAKTHAVLVEKQEALPQDALKQINIALNIPARLTAATQNKGNTALHVAINTDRIEIVKAVLFNFNNKTDAPDTVRNNLDINQKNNDKQTPLMLAAAKNNQNTINVLLKHGASIDSSWHDHALKEAKTGIHQYHIQLPKAVALPDQLNQCPLCVNDHSNHLTFQHPLTLEHQHQINTCVLCKTTDALPSIDN